MNRTKVRRRREQHHIGAFDDTLVGVEPDETARFGDVDLLFDVLLFVKRLKAAFEPILERITHGNQFHVRIPVQGLVGGAGATSAATNQPDAKRFPWRHAFLLAEGISGQGSSNNAC